MTNYRAERVQQEEMSQLVSLVNFWDKVGPMIEFNTGKKTDVVALDALRRTPTYNTPDVSERVVGSTDVTVIFPNPAEADKAVEEMKTA